MALNFKVEWFRGEESDEGMFVHTQIDMPCYQELIDKEEYNLYLPEERCTLINNLFAIPGIVEVSVKAYRVYVVKAELFKWDTLAGQVLGVIGTALGQSTYNELPGSRLTLDSVKSRRPL